MSSFTTDLSTYLSGYNMWRLKRLRSLQGPLNDFIKSMDLATGDGESMTDQYLTQILQLRDKQCGDTYLKDFLEYLDEYEPVQILPSDGVLISYIRHMISSMKSMRDCLGGRVDPVLDGSTVSVYTSFIKRYEKTYNDKITVNEFDAFVQYVLLDLTSVKLTTTMDAQPENTESVSLKEGTENIKKSNMQKWYENPIGSVCHILDYLEDKCTILPEHLNFPDIVKIKSDTSINNVTIKMTRFLIIALEELDELLFTKYSMHLADMISSIVSPKTD